MQETSLTNAATTVSEGSAKPEATFVVVEKDAPVKKIAVTAKVTDELFADYPAMRDYVNERLRLMLALTEENQLLNGLGTGSEITGIAVTSGVQTHARATDSDAEGILKGADKVRTIGFLEPDGVVFNPADWQKIRLSKDVNGQYYAGGPFYSPYGVGPMNAATMDNNPPIWGLRVVTTPAQTAGTALVGAFRTAAQLFYREGVRVDVSNSNVDDFVKNLLTIRCEERLALAVYRPKGFCTVTGLSV
jgi:HK97 family phage major capsid protein